MATLQGTVQRAAATVREGYSAVRGAAYSGELQLLRPGSLRTYIHVQAPMIAMA